MQYRTRLRHLAAPLFGAALALVSFTLAVPVLPQDAPQKDSAAAEIAKATKLFASACISCHLPPDPEVMTDRAWLSQVSDTA